jgi:hypothetical protein
MLEENLSDKINSLSEKNMMLFYERLYDILEDRFSSLIYGGITKKEYSNPPRDKIEKIKEKLYLEIIGQA